MFYLLLGCDFVISIQSISDALNDFVVSRTLPETVNIPRNIQLELTTRCNLKCINCPRKDIPIKDMTFDEFKIILSNFPRVSGISYLGLGETFLNNDVFEITKYAKSKGIQVTAFTNGSMLVKQMRKKILDSGFDHVIFSVDGALKETHERIRPGSNFDSLKEIIRNLKSEAKAVNNPVKLGFSVVRTRSNVEELPGIIELASELGIDGVLIEDVEVVFEKQFYPSDYNWLRKEALHLASDEEKKGFKKIICLTIKKAKQAGIEIYMDKTLLPLRKRGGCKFPWQFVGVRANGEISVCCLIGVFSNGNIFEQSLSEIWNNSKYKKLRN